MRDGRTKADLYLADAMFDIFTRGNDCHPAAKDLEHAYTGRDFVSRQVNDEAGRGVVTPHGIT